MKKVLLSFVLVLSLLASAFASTGRDENSLKEAICCEDYLYAVKDNDSLFLSRYYNSANVSVAGENSPLIIFAFGGGFFAGQRNSKAYLDFFKYYANKGFQVVTIDYRRGLRPFFLRLTDPKYKGEKFKIKPSKMVQIFVDAVNMATADMVSATNFVLSMAHSWKIDVNKIVISGSSAGAITALQTEYYRSNGFLNEQYGKIEPLPCNFKYAGVISFAGAVLSTKGKPSFPVGAAPILFFHGNADSNVPYNKMKTPWGGLYGPEFLSESLQKNHQPFYFYTFNNFNHSIAVSPMNDNRSAIDYFLEHYVLKDEKLIENRTQTVIGMPDVKKKFSIKDYIKSNFKPSSN